MSKYYHELKNVFKKIDYDERVFKIFFKKHFAWPLVKERLWLYLLRKNQPIAPSIKKNILLKISRVFLGGIEFISFFLFSRRKEIVFAVTPRFINIQACKKFHPYFGEVLEKYKDRSFNIYYGGGGKEKLEKGVLHEKYFGCLINLLSRFNVKRKETKATVNEIKQLLQDMAIPCSAKEIDSVCSQALSLFELKYYSFKKIFKRIRPNMLVVQDPDGKAGEVLAAKALEIKVIEIQHGIFSRYDIDYSWTHEYREYKKTMPVADIMLVHGEFWKNEILKNHFYKIDEVKIFNYEIIQYLRELKSKPASKNKILLYPTQGYVIEQAFSFWKQFLELSAHDNIELWIKIHPNDCSTRYLELVDKYPEKCRVFLPKFNSYELLWKCDYVVGYTSSMLLEGLALNKQVISISEDNTEDDLCKNYGIDFLSSFIVNIRLPKEVKQYIENVGTIPNIKYIANQLYAYNSDSVIKRLEEVNG